MDINTYCSKYFKYVDFIECSDTQKAVRVDNIPQQTKTFESIAYLANTILDPVYEKFGALNLTYGLCSHNLQKHIKKNVAPNLDQHAGSELNSKGNLICPREGFAVDFKVENITTDNIARYIVENLQFDRLYFYGRNRPVHVSATTAKSCKNIVVFNNSAIRRTPQNMTANQFIEHISDLDDQEKKSD